MVKKIVSLPKVSAAGLGVAVAVCLCLLGTAGAWAVCLDIASSPIQLTTSVKPNVILAIDDSGSMDGEVLMPGNDGAAWWHTGDKAFSGRDRNDNSVSGVINFNSAGTASSTWKKYVYLFPNGSGTGNRIYTDSTHDHYAIPPLPQFAYYRSPAYNKMYFDPSSTYTPWVEYGATTFADATVTSAVSDPVRGGNVLNMTANIDRSDANWTFKLQPGMVLPAGTIYNGATLTSSLTIGAETNGRISYYPATFYLPQGTVLPEGFGYTATPTSNGRGPGGQVLEGYEIKSSNFSSAEAYNKAIQNFANWYSYYRKRHIATRGGIGRAFKNITNMRVASFTINNRINVSMLDLAVGSDRDTFFTQVYSSVGSGGTPNREALKHIGDQFKRTGSGAPITHACQLNFGILFTDGYSNVWTGAAVGNADGNQGDPYQDSVSNSMADIAMYYYLNNPRPDLPTGKVVPNENCPGPSLACNTNLHMTTYAITLGGQGNIFGVDTAKTADPYSFPPTWPTSFPDRHPSAVDDLWHATINGRGALLNAASAGELSEKFEAVLGNITKAASSSTAMAANSTRYKADTKIFQASFDTDNWSGDVTASNIDNKGKVTGEAWKASKNIPDPGSRNIFTFNPSTGGGTAFSWANLDSAQQTALNTNISGVVDGKGSARLDYLRGSRSGEGSAYRLRSSVLGDIVNSDPVYVGTTEDYGYSSLSGEGGTYAGFLSAKKTRKPMLYVGANDGMLHAFDAGTGQEKFAYVPSGVYSNLSKLTSYSPPYSHQFYVDGPAWVGDAYVNGSWRSILIGALGAGGRSVFALDVTNPSAFGASNVLWEITHNDLGYVMGPPSVVRLDGGDWVAIFGNGYNSNNCNGTAKLFVVNLQTKAVTVISTDSTTSNGLGPPVPVDIDGDLDADFAYAGDLQGNLWKFDLTGNSSTWKVAYKQGNTPKPLFVARDSSGKVQPITARPTVGQASNGDVLVFFGTGKFIGSSDRLVSSTTPIQSFYGIKDKGSPIATTNRSDLQAQTIIKETATYRLTSKNAVADSKMGWYLDLYVSTKQGEMVVNPALLVYGKILFTTLIPPVDDPCSPGGDSWLMVMDAMTGGRAEAAVLDVNQDGKVDGGDNQKSTGAGADDVVSGSKMDGIVEISSIIENDDGEGILPISENGKIRNLLMDLGVDFGRDRQSWRQLR